MYILTDYRLILKKDRPDLSLLRVDPSGTALARSSSNSKLQIRPLVREGATKQQTPKCLKKMSRRKNNWSRVPGWGPDTKTVGRNVTSTSQSCVEAD
jgi:hypothetical protein